MSNRSTQAVRCPYVRKFTAVPDNWICVDAELDANAALSRIEAFMKLNASSKQLFLHNVCEPSQPEGWVIATQVLPADAC